jgi:23S rRNA G2069 N7-methylase RlmK/C1962 C5-methylase RlmI
MQERVLSALLHALAPALGPDPPRIEVVHLRDAPEGVVRVCHSGGALPAGLAAGGRLVVRERGLRFGVDPGLARPERSSPAIGLFLDQRENRARLAECARRGGRWLNLFAHTGAFSVALLAAGAESVTSVDLSGAYLRWLEENLAHNALVGPRHTAVRADGRRHLERLPPETRFEGIVLDPPTAAAAGRRFWSARRDLPPLVGRALARLVPGGVLLVSRHQRATRGGLGELVQRAAKDAGVSLREVAPAPPGPDFPSLAGFPEGDPFEAVLAWRA